MIHKNKQSANRIQLNLVICRWHLSCITQLIYYRDLILKILFLTHMKIFEKNRVLIICRVLYDLFADKCSGIYKSAPALRTNYSLNWSWGGGGGLSGVTLAYISIVCADMDWDKWLIGRKYQKNCACVMSILALILILYCMTYKSLKSVHLTGNHCVFFGYYGQNVYYGNIFSIICP